MEQAAEGDWGSVGVGLMSLATYKLSSPSTSPRSRPVLAIPYVAALLLLVASRLRSACDCRRSDPPPLEAVLLVVAFRWIIPTPGRTRAREAGIDSALF
jgi:hypothetical protein